MIGQMSMELGYTSCRCLSRRIERAMWQSRRQDVALFGRTRSGSWTYTSIQSPKRITKGSLILQKPSKFCFLPSVIVFSHRLWVEFKVPFFQHSPPWSDASGDLLSLAHRPAYHAWLPHHQEGSHWWTQVWLILHKNISKLFCLITQPLATQCSTCPRQRSWATGSMMSLLGSMVWTQIMTEKQSWSMPFRCRWILIKKKGMCFYTV